MKIKLIDFGVREDWRPYRPHGNDAGADVYMPYDCTLKPGDVEKVPLGFGIEVPDGYAGYVFPRSSMAARGLVCELPPCGFRLPRGNPCDHQQCKQQDPGHQERGAGGAAYHNAGGDCGFCFRAWGGKRHGRVWEHRGVIRESTEKGWKAAQPFREAPLLQSELF